MPVNTKQLTSWSFSRYSDWKSCPLKAKLKHIDKLKEPPNAAMERGAAIHTLAENYIKGSLPVKVPPELAKFSEELKQLRKAYKSKTLPVIVEDNWAFTEDWTQTQWNDWVNCWVRIKLDCAHYMDEGTMVVVDWKTGKSSPYKLVEYEEQMELYALAALLLHPHLEAVFVELAFTDEGKTHPPRDKPKKYTQADVVKLRATWSKRVKPMMSDTKFPPKANATCQWCWFGESGKKRGGPGLCKF